MICSSEKRFFTSNLLGIGNWTPNQGATQTRGDVGVRARLAPARRPCGKYRYMPRRRRRCPCTSGNATDQRVQIVIQQHVADVAAAETCSRYRSAKRRLRRDFQLFS
ncbi:hypothetical protein EYC54_02895 [Xanthomonas oryzae]|nr:hypothetical protein EYC54_02895 [Xanthomonas oryzae]